MTVGNLSRRILTSLSIRCLAFGGWFSAIAAAGAEKFSYFPDLERGVHCSLFAFEEDLSVGEKWQPGDGSCLLPLPRLINKAGSRISKPYPDGAEVGSPTCAEWLRQSATGPFRWVLDCDWGVSIAEHGKMSIFSGGAVPHNFILPNGGRVWMKTSPMTNAEIKANYGEKVHLPAHSPCVVVSRSLKAPPNGQFFSEVNNLATRSVEQVEGKAEDLRKTERWRLEKDEMTVPLKDLVQRTAANIHRTREEKDYVWDVVKITWLRHGMGNTPTWILTIWLQLRPDPSRENFMRDGASYHGSSFFPNGGEVTSSTRPMTPEEMQQFGVKPHGTAAKDDEAAQKN